jgi:hypothetical protein
VIGRNVCLGNVHVLYLKYDTVKMKKILLVALLCMVGAAQAQVNQVLRKEIELDDARNTDQLAVGKYGLVLYGPKEVKGNANFELTQYDTLLNEVRRIQMEVPKKHSASAKAFSPDGRILHLIYQVGNDVTIYSVDLADGSHEKLRFKLPKPLNPDHVACLSEHVYFTSNDAKKVLIWSVHLKTAQVTQLKTPIFDKFMFLESINANPTQNLITVAISSGSSKKIGVVQNYHVLFYEQGVVAPKEQLKLTNEMGRLIVDATVTWQGINEFTIAGAYSTKSDKNAEGLYLAYFEQGTQQWMRHYSFSDFPNFYEFMPQRKMQERKAKKNAAKGMDDFVKSRVVVHDVYQFKNEFILIGECFQPTYMQMPVTTTVNGQIQTTYQTIFDGYLYTHAVVIGANFNGERQWGEVFGIETVTKPYSIVQKIRAIADQESFRMFYPYKTKIKVMQVLGSELVETAAGELLPESEMEKVKKALQPVSQHWYRNFILVTGIQVIEANKKEGIKRRKLFFMSKIQVDTSGSLPND